MEKRNSGKKPFRPKGKPGQARTTAKKNEESNAQSGLTRLNKFLAHSGIASRREADNLIKAGLVEINGKVVTEMGYKVNPSDEVKFNGETLRAEKKVYVLLNKPKGFITTADDPKARKTVMELVANAGNERIYPVGRLDRKTMGVLLFTNDGDLAKKLTHPSYGARKIYEVSLDKPLTKSDFTAIQDGLELEDGPIKVDEISYVEGKSKNNIGVVLHSGRNRIVRRIFESLDYEVTKLDRVFFAGLTKKNLNRGQWRYLSPKEVSFLQMKT
jgi:23S rRNA pseudouridine2605 synthase